MSFPVPIKYLLNENQDATVVVYDDGKEIEGLPADITIPPGVLLKHIEITPEADITSANPLTLQLMPVGNGPTAVAYFCLDDITPTDTDIVCYALRFYRDNNNLTYINVVYKPDGSFRTAANTYFGSFRPTTGLLTIPGDGVIIKGGKKYCVVQFKVGAVV